MNKEELLEKIEKIRKNMYKLVNQKGITCLQVITTSQNLDDLLNDYDNIRN